jgi:8-oxo-dGTP pyrophosphatase MutT (NUDIX family)
MEGSLVVRQRACVIIINEGKILLLHRHKYGRRYYLVPGGGVEAGESIEDAAVREAREETGLDVTLDGKLWEVEDRRQLEHYFLCGGFNGSLHLGGPEAERQSRDNVYRLEWVRLSALDDLPLRPPGLVEKIYSLFSR